MLIYVNCCYFNRVIDVGTLSLSFMPYASIQVDSCIRYYIIVISVYDRCLDRDCDRDRLRLCLRNLNKHC